MVKFESVSDLQFIIQFVSVTHELNVFLDQFAFEPKLVCALNIPLGQSNHLAKYLF